MDMNINIYKATWPFSKITIADPTLGLMTFPAMIF